MSYIREKDTIVFIPMCLKDERLKVKFAYLALRNLIYHNEKLAKTKPLEERKLTKSTNVEMANQYFKLQADNNSLTEDEIKKLKDIFSKPNLSVVVKNDLFKWVEKQIPVSEYVFMSYALVEISFCIGEDYFSPDYILSVLSEMSQKMGVALGENLSNFILSVILKLIEDLSDDVL